MTRFSEFNDAELWRLCCALDAEADYAGNEQPEQRLARELRDESLKELTARGLSQSTGRREAHAA